MRTTVTLDADLVTLLKDAAHRQGKPFKTLLNDAVRAGLRGTAAIATALTWPTFDMGQPLVDLTKAAALADELDDIDRFGGAPPPVERTERQWQEKLGASVTRFDADLGGLGHAT